MIFWSGTRLVWEILTSENYEKYKFPILVEFRQNKFCHHPGMQYIKFGVDPSTLTVFARPILISGA